MFRSARNVANAAQIEADICIIGAGPAGTTLARELVGSGLTVLLLEAGSLADDKARNDLSALATGFSYGTERKPTNLQRFGGNAHAWNIRSPYSRNGVRLARFRDADFEARSDLLGSEWPIKASDLEGASLRAAELWTLSVDGFTPQPRPAPEDRLLDLGPDVSNATFQFPDAAPYLRNVKDTLKAAQNTTVLLDAVTTAIEFDGARAVRARVSSSPGHEFTVTAGRFVVAAGAFNACKLLFASRMPDGHAPGNAQDALGRYFMDHPSVHGGVLYPATPSIFRETRRYDIRPENSVPAMVHLCISDDRLREGGVLGLSSQLFPRDSSYQWGGKMSERAYRSTEGALAVRRRLEARSMPRASDILAALSGADILARHVHRRLTIPWSSMRKGGWSQSASTVSKYSVFEVMQLVEQAPHADNRILQSNETDHFGQRRVTLDWRWHDADQERTIAAQKVFEAAVEAAGIGRIDHARPDGKIRLSSSSSYHHIGGLRMGNSPRDSVTDRNCRIHGTENLYVAGAGLFPTGSYANPTFLISALAVRLAGHLRQMSLNPAASRALSPVQS